MLIIKKKERLMSIDSSVNNLGIAIWDMSSKKLLLWKLVHPKSDCRSNEYEKSWSILCQLKEWIKIYAINHIICEVPTYWAIGGFEARETGSMNKLSFVCGLIYSLRGDMEKFKLVTPSDWKGQLSKIVTQNRLQDEYWAKYQIDMNGTATGKKLNDNVSDAIGIGHFKLFGSV